MMQKKTTFGIIVGSRNFFPAHLCREGRDTMLQVIAEEGCCAVCLGDADTRYGSVETLDDALKAAELFKQHAPDLDGFIITLPNFGDERAAANSIRYSGLNLPVLVHAYPDRRGKMDQDNRRDSYCGKMSVCNNLHQYGVPFTLTRKHTVDPTAESFRQDLRSFAATCRVVRGLRRARIGALGARPAGFNTVRFSEKLLERSGIAVETLDLSEAFGRANSLADDDPIVAEKRTSIEAYARVAAVPHEALTRMAKFGVVIDRWMVQSRLDATAIQCWTSMEQYFGAFPCTLMSMMSNKLIPAACETDVVGAVGMYALALASGRPGALIDWNNNYEDEDDMGVIFHCSNLPAQLLTDIPVMTHNPGVAADFGLEQSFGILSGRVKADPFTFLRISTDDTGGRIQAYIGEGELTDDPLDTYGGYGVAHIERFQDLLQHICRNGFEHHVAITPARVAPAVHEALTSYLEWETYYHR